MESPAHDEVWVETESTTHATGIEAFVPVALLAVILAFIAFLIAWFTR